MGSTGLTDKSRKQFMGRNKNIVNRVIRGHLAKIKIGIVHGGRSQNVQLPRRLKRDTRDWDIFVRNPERSAQRLERKLDNKFGGDFFSVKKGATEKLRVNKVVSNVTGKSHADFSVPDRIVETVSKRGVRFASLKDQFEKAKANVKDEDKSFRKQKDLDLIRRVRKFEKGGRRLR